MVAAIGLVFAVQDPPRFTEKVDVARVLIDVRALDGHGRPLLDLDGIELRGPDRRQARAG